MTNTSSEHTSPGQISRSRRWPRTPAGRGNHLTHPEVGHRRGLHRAPPAARRLSVAMRVVVSAGRRRWTAVTGVVAALVMTLVLVGAPSAAAAQPPVGLGTAGSFAVLAGSTVTNTGPSTISGDLGVSPGTAITGFPPGTVSNGTQHSADAVAAGAQADLVTAYVDAAGRTPAASVSADIGGQTLPPGVYQAASALGLTGTVTLDGKNDPSAVFIFQVGSTLITASNSTVNLINGAQSCNVFWQVGSSATLGTNTTLVGNILALTSVSVLTGTTIQGRVLARNGQVSLDTNTITRPVCAAIPPTTTSAPVQTTTSTPVQTTTSAPVQTTTSAPVQTTTSAPVQTTTSAPAQTTTSAPVQTTTSALVQTTTSAPVQTTTSAPAQSALVQTTTSAPVQTTTSAPAQSALVQTTTSAPVQTTTSAPAQSALGSGGQGGLGGPGSGGQGGLGGPGSGGPGGLGVPGSGVPGSGFGNTSGSGAGGGTVIPLGHPETGAGGAAYSPGNAQLALGGLALLGAGGAIAQAIRRRRIPVHPVRGR